MGLYKGFVPMLLRDVPGWGVYFFTYEYLKSLMRLDSSEQKSIQQMSNLEILTLMWAGGVAGQMSWIVSYPWDVIKTTMQCTETQRLSMR
jgi:solute carrier family 25 (mitochondrial carnitine/acylcarnitine transporter), member 20/29